MQTLSTPKQIFAIAGLFAVTVIWGSTFILVKWTVSSLDVYYFLFLRFLIATAFLGILFHKHLKKTKKSTIGAAFILSLFVCGTFASQTEGLRFTSASNSALITGLYLVLIPVVSTLFFRQKPELQTIIGAVTSLAGLYLLTGFSIGGFNFGDGITLICAVTCAFHIILTGKFARSHSLIPLVLFQFIFVTLFSFLITLAKGSFTINIQPIAWITILITSILATALAFTVQTLAQRVIDSSRTGIIFALEAVFGVLFGYLLGNEVLTTVSLIGAVLMVLGMAIAESKPAAKYLIDKITG